MSHMHQTFINYGESCVKAMVHLLRLWLLRRQADYKHHPQGEEGQHGGEVQVVDVLHHRWPGVLLEAQRLRVNEVQHHADDTHRQADGKAPECTLGGGGRTQGRDSTTEPHITHAEAVGLS